MGDDMTSKKDVGVKPFIWEFHAEGVSPVAINLLEVLAIEEVLDLDKDGKRHLAFKFPSGCFYAKTGEPFAEIVDAWNDALAAYKYCRD